MKVALLIVGHGSRDPRADDVLPFYVEQLSKSGRFSTVQACYLEKPPRISEAVQAIDADRIIVMPLLLAHGYHTRATIPEELDITPPGGVVNGKEIILLEPLGRSEHIVRLIEERVMYTL
ncbi:sirohydrochlorin chelatase [Methanocella arvoryzae]|uniref:Sirohydrochlorin cobaltochelatase n=1 Tax=Methanocella arvoryzae (strain DSM 22066 / NBRC 105507 / MRE50) TaxID=351160 RepID=Q0W7P2_METAR|nr:CbiX/SirB N-terminal domain-containing protein [Methanocella arvoryzae]CAJ35601.1 putative sirohydrochlorin cobaltochelatase [Methanocella arvoryzae MRE50]